MRNKVLSLLLAVILGISLCPFKAEPIFAAGGSENEKAFTVVESSNGLVITGYTGKEAKLYIPEEIDGEPVTVIGEYILYKAKVQQKGGAEPWKHLKIICQGLISEFH